MKDARMLLEEYIGQIEKIIIEFKYNEDFASSLLVKLKETLAKKESVQAEQKEIFGACVYNALATINTVLIQDKSNRQLLMALTEAKEEMKAIMEFL